MGRAWKMDAYIAQFFLSFFGSSISQFDSKTMQPAWIISCVLLVIIFSLLLFRPTEKHVTCGSAIKLAHVESGGKFYILSDERQLQSGSGQQLVTAIDNNRSPNGLWQVREREGEQMCEAGTPVKCGDIIRLMHVTTGKNLHTHGIQSPLSAQHEVTGFGDGQGGGDSGDNWIVTCESSSYFSSGPQLWLRDEPIQFKSVDTSRYLGASSTVKFTESNCGRSCPILHHLEVFGRKTGDKYTQWKADLGVYLSK